MAAMPSRRDATGSFCVDRLAADFERAVVGLEGAGDDLDQRRFARAVLADQGMDLAGCRSNETPLSACTPANDLADVRWPEAACTSVYPQPFPSPLSA